MAVPLESDRHHVAAGGIIIGRRRIGGDRLYGNGDAGRIGKRKIALRRHRFGRIDFELAGAALLVEVERFLDR